VEARQGPEQFEIWETVEARQGPEQVEIWETVEAREGPEQVEIWEKPFILARNLTPISQSHTP